MDDLEVGFWKPKQNATTAPPSPPAQTDEEMQIDSLQKMIKKMKKAIKHTSREVWVDRDDIVSLQRRNWSVRKGLIQGEAPEESVTGLNLKIEKVLRQEREIDLELDQIDEEKHFIEQECSQLAKAVNEFKDLLDALNTQIVPLLPSSPAKRYNPVHEARRDNVVSTSISEDLSETMHSTDGDPYVATMEDDVNKEVDQGMGRDGTGADTDEEPSLSLRHLRMEPI